MSEQIQNPEEKDRQENNQPEERRGILRNNLHGFLEFIRHQGVIGLAIGFILGSGVGKVVDALVKDIVNPILGIVIGKAGGLAAASYKVFGVEFLWGHFLSILIDFLVIALVVYIGVKIIGIDRLDKKKP